MELADVINKSDLVLEPKVDYNVVVISMNELAKDAINRKQTFLKTLYKDIPPEKKDF